MRAASALALIAILPLLAGCTDGGGGPEEAPGTQPLAPGLTPGELRAGGFYTFRHEGGTLVFTLGEEGDASFDLFDGADLRLGSVGFSSSPSGSSMHTIEGVQPGDLVLRLTTINGTLRVESGGRSVTSFRPLGVAVERHVLVDLDPRPNPLPGIVIPLPTSDGSYSGTMDVAFRRAPVGLRVLATGPDAGLLVEVRSSKGVVLVADGDEASPQAAIGELVLYPIPGEFTPQNVRDGSFTVTVTADDLGGAVVLEAQSYSRAPLPAEPVAGPDPADVPFTYGALPRSPVGFTVHDDARRIFLWQDEAAADNATVALFDADDRRIATVLVPGRGSIAVTVQGGGEHVAVLLEGDATLGADVAPSDFDLHPLERSVTVLPVAVAGSYQAPEGGRYGQGTEEADLPTAFALRANRTSASEGDEFGDDAQFNPFCGTHNRGRYLAIDQGGEAVLAYLEGLDEGNEPGPAFMAGTRALGSGPVQVHFDGFGADGCDRPVIDVLSYVRP